MNRLLKIGFQPAGHWAINNGKIQFELTQYAGQKNILYAFLCDGQVKYIGKTVQALAARMGGYKNPGRSQTTNINNNRRIGALLEQGAAVDIMALPDTGLLHYGEFHLNLAAALEDDLIRVVQPEWNGGIKADGVPLPSLNSEVKSPPDLSSLNGEFTFTLHKTYFGSGFFNAGIGPEGLLGRDGEVIEIFLGNGHGSILGTINRRATGNNSPRVMGGADLRDWFQKSGKAMETVAVEVMSPTSIRLQMREAGMMPPGSSVEASKNKQKNG